jgi:hypothetical protein
MFDICFSNSSNTGEFRLELLYTRPYIVIMFLHQKHRQESSLPDSWRHFIFTYSIKYAKPLSLPLTPARVFRYYICDLPQEHGDEDLGAN